MGKIYINDLIAGDTVDSTFLVNNIQMRQRKNGGSFLTMELSDRSGNISATMWEGFNHLELRQLKFLKIDGCVNTYQNKPQIIINSASYVDESSITLSDYLPATSKDIKEMMAFINARAGQVKNRFLRELLHKMLEDQQFAAKLIKTPAAKSLHNAYIGGLLEHIYDLLHLADFITEYYTGLNKDLLVTGIIFHDLGKVTELAIDKNIEYTDEGKLLGHNILGMDLVDKYSAMVSGFPHNISVHIKHMILSHHGKPEWGSPKQPMTLEAVVLHYLDNMDSKIRGFQQFIEKDRSISDNWTNRSFMFDNIELFKQVRIED
ncbi:3'-5' exoribonuclease YhaM family protein [Candidatus Margulisiibacteriota bacterium]